MSREHAGPGESLAKSTETAARRSTPHLNGRFLASCAAGPGADEIDGLVRAYRQRAAGAAANDVVLLHHSLGRGDHVHHELILGENNLLPFDFLRTGDRLGRAVVKIVRGDGAVGTGFMVAPDILLTNHHVLPDPRIASAASAIANYESAPATDSAGRVSVVGLHPDDLFVTSDELDFTFCGVRGLDYLGTIALDRNGLNILMSEYVNIIQHPRGRTKQVALQDNQVVAADAVVVRYSCDTEPGSSGSPVFNNQWRLVALHHASVLTRPDEGGRPARDADPTRHYLNEGIRLSAIALWLDSEHAVASTRPDQLARLRGIFRGLDPRAGLFGGLGRRARDASAAQLVVESYRRSDQCVDFGYWDLATLEQHPSWDRLDALAWTMTDLGMDVWCLAGLGDETAQRLCRHLQDRFRLGFVAQRSEGGAAERGPMAILCRADGGWQARIGTPPGASDSERNWPWRIRLTSAHTPALGIEVVVGTAALPIPGVVGGAWGAQSGFTAATGRRRRAQVWIEAANAARGEQTPRDAATDRTIDLLFFGPGVPATSDGLSELRQSGLVARAAALGRDGGFVLLPGEPSRVARVYLSPQFLPVLGRGADVVVASETPLPREAGGLSPFEPLAARIVLGEPTSATDSGEPVDAVAPPSDPHGAGMADMVSEIIEPIVARMIARLREDAGPR